MNHTSKWTTSLWTILLCLTFSKTLYCWQIHTYTLGVLRSFESSGFTLKTRKNINHHTCQSYVWCEDHRPHCMLRRTANTCNPCTFQSRIFNLFNVFVVLYLEGMWILVLLFVLCHECFLSRVWFICVYRYTCMLAMNMSVIKYIFWNGNLLVCCVLHFRKFNTENENCFDWWCDERLWRGPYSVLH